MRVGVGYTGAPGAAESVRGGLSAESAGLKKLRKRKKFN
jgi:hypothetical protein